MSSKLIVALDFNNQNEVLTLVDQINPSDCKLKIGSELFTRFGPQFVTQLIDRSFKVFLDLKFHDIPNTVAQSCKAAADLGVWMVNVHASGGLEMMQAATKALDSYGSQKPLLIAVTVLTSMNEAQLPRIGTSLPLLDQVVRLASLAQEAGLDGVVSSAQEVKIIKAHCGNSFLAVTPGIRLEHSLGQDDQSRVMTPQQAIQEGSDYLVIGRPITQAVNPSSVIRDLVVRYSAIQN